MSNTVHCTECDADVQPERELGLRGSYGDTYRIDLQCPHCEGHLGTLPNPEHPENNVTPDELEQDFEQYFSPAN